MREDKERKGNGEWRMENGEWRTVAPQFSILHSSFFLLVWEVQMTKYKVPQSRRENLNTLSARRLCGSILLFLAQRLRQRGLSQDAIGFR
jgi:hypothetical protein